MTITRQADNYKMGLNALGITLHQTSWNKGQITLTQERDTDVFRGEEDEDLFGEGAGGGQGVAIGSQMISKESILGEVSARVASLNTESGQTALNVPGASGETSGGLNMQAEVSIKDIIEDRQE